MTEKKSKKLGAELKSVREKQGKSLEEISIRTKINLKYLTSIENDQFDFLHTPYVLAFVKAYAKILGLDQNEITEMFNEHIRTELDFSIQENSVVLNDQQNRPVADSPAESGPGTTGTVTTIPQSDKSKPVIVGSLIVVLIACVFLFQKFFKSSEEPETTQPVNPPVAEEPAVETGVDSVQVAAISPDQISMSLAATDSIWFRVQIDSLDAREYIFGPGDSSSWNADDRFELRTGKSTGINVYLNGERIRNLGNETTLIWSLVLTRNGVESRQLRNR